SLAWLGMIALPLVTARPALAGRLRGLFEAQPEPGVVERYRFHSDFTYEWSREVEGEHFRDWQCGRYALQGRVLVLYRDSSEQSCSRHRTAPEDSVSEQWLLRGKLTHEGLVLGGQLFAPKNRKAELAVAGAKASSP